MMFWNLSIYQSSAKTSYTESDNQKAECTEAKGEASEELWEKDQEGGQYQEYK